MYNNVTDEHRRNFLDALGKSDIELNPFAQDFLKKKTGDSTFNDSERTVIDRLISKYKGMVQTDSPTHDPTAVRAAPKVEEEKTSPRQVKAKRVPKKKSLSG